MAAQLVQIPRRKPQVLVFRLLSIVVGVTIVNASLVFGWRGWIFFASPYRIFLAVLLSLEVVLARLLENANTGVRTVGRQAWVGLFGPFWIIFNIAAAWSLRSAGAVNPLEEVIGIALFSLGLALRVWSAVTLGSFFSLHVTVFSGQAPVTRGPYAFSRHPAYLGTMIQLFGLGFMFNAPLVAGIGVLVFSIVLVFRIRDEERLMLESFPETYGDYQRRVPVFLPAFSWPAREDGRRLRRVSQP